MDLLILCSVPVTCMLHRLSYDRQQVTLLKATRSVVGELASISPPSGSLLTPKGPMNRQRYLKTVREGWHSLDLW